MKYVRTTAFGILFIACAMAGILLAATFAPLEDLPAMRIVLSGSMEPNLPVGSVVFIIPAVSYSVGDIITFANREGAVPTTHRVTALERESGSVRYVTKGDANEEADHERVAHGEVLGKVAFTVPRLGYVFEFARSKYGFIVMIAIPAGLIILDELLNIWGALRGVRRERATAPVWHTRQDAQPLREKEEQRRHSMPRQTLQPASSHARAGLNGYQIVLRPV